MEQWPRYRIIGRIPFWMPLNREAKPLRPFDIDRFGGSIGGRSVDDDSLSRPTYPLPVERIGHDLARAEQLGKGAVWCQRDLVADGKFVGKRSVWRHPVIVAPRQIADFGIERAAHGHIDLLKAPANSQKGLAPLDTGPDKRKGDGIAIAVKRAVRRCFVLAIFLGMDIGATAGQQKPVAGLEQFRHRYDFRVSRDQKRHCARHMGNRAGIHRPDRVNRIVVAKDV